MKISYKVLFAVVLSIAGTNAFAADVTGLATTNYVKGAIGSLDSSVTNANGAISTITITDGKITNVTRKSVATNDLAADAVTNAKLADNAVQSENIKDGTIVNADIADTAAIATSKINGLDTALSGKQTTDNMIKAKADVTEVNMEATDKYPSMAAAQQIAATVVTKNIMSVDQQITTLNTKYTELSTTVENNKAAAEKAIADLDGDVTGTSGVVKTISQTDGKVTASRGLVAAADIDSNAVTTDKIANANVTADKLATNAVTTAKIADSNVTTAKIANANVTTDKLAPGAVTREKTTGIWGRIPSGSMGSTTGYAEIWVQ